MRERGGERGEETVGERELELERRGGRARESSDKDGGRGIRVEGKRKRRRERGGECGRESE
jgi:hypothetical protein